MSFYERFELLELVRDDGIKTFAAREFATGRSVLVHLFVNLGAADSQAMLALLSRLSEQERLRIVDRGDNGGTPYLVTGPLAEYAGLREWLAAKGAPANPPASQPESPRLNAAGAWRIAPPPPVSQALEGAEPTLDQQFADLFETADHPLPAPPRSPVIAVAPPGMVPTPKAPRPPAAPLPAPEKTLQLPVSLVPPPAPVLSQPGAAPDGPGEFTRMFQAPPPAPKPVAPEAKTPEVQSPGEFTRMFASSPPPPKPVASEGKTPEAPAPGEFTRMFQVPAATSSPQVSPPVSPPAPASADSKAAPDPGEFTQMFQTPPSSPAAAPGPAARQPFPPPAKAPGEFTQMFQIPPRRSASDPVGPSAPSPAPPKSSADQRPDRPPDRPPDQPGEFTRFFESPMSPGPLPQGPGGQKPGGAQPFPPPGKVAPNGPGEFTRVFGPRDVPAPQAPSMPVAPRPDAGATQSFATPLAPAPRATAPQGPGEYTRMFAAQAPLTLGQQQSPQTAPASGPAKSTSRLPMILAVSAVVLIVVALIFLAFRK